MTNPIFRRIIRAMRVIVEGAKTIENLAENVRENEQVDGAWPPGSEEAEQEYNRLKAQSAELRALIHPAKAGGAHAS